MLQSFSHHAPLSARWPRTSWASVTATILASGVATILASSTGCTGTPSDPARSEKDASAADLPNDEQFCNLIDEVLDFTLSERRLRTDVHAAWQILHGVLAYGLDYQVVDQGKPVGALDWALNGAAMTGWTMRKGSVGLKAVLEAGSRTGQGHEDQWLAVIAQSGLPTDHPITVGTNHYTIGDLVQQSKYDVYDGKECAWTTIGLSAYVPVQAEWKARDGSLWSLARIMAMEAAADRSPDEAQRQISESACGGSHRLIGMTMALARYRAALAKEGQDPAELTGPWLAADERIRWAVNTARMFQLPSGAFSVDYFQRSSTSSDLVAHLGSTGHTLEFLSLALDKEELAEPWVARGALHLCEVFQNTRDLDLECGALYHAAHALVLYRLKRFGPRKPAAE